MEYSQSTAGESSLFAEQFVPVGIRAVALTRALEHWASRYPSTIPYALPVAMAHSFAWPWLDVDDLLRGSKATMWIFGSDNMLDTNVMAPNEVEAMLQRQRETAAGASPDPQDECDVMLSEIRTEITGQPLFASMGPMWQEALDRTLTARLFEHVHGAAIAAGARPPSLEEYLDQSGPSFGSDFIHLGRIICTEDLSILPHLDRLTAALKEYRMVGRLSNDLYEYEREMAEPAPLNVLMFGVNRQWVTEQIALHLDRCEEILEPLIADGSGAALGIVRLAHWVATYYRGSGDWHVRT